MYTCPECQAPFEPPSKRQIYCSLSCRLKVWRRNRHQKDPEKVRSEWRQSHHRNREKRIRRMRDRYAEHIEAERLKHRKWFASHRGEQNAKRLAYHHAHKAEANMARSENYQKTRMQAPGYILIKAAQSRAKRKRVVFCLTKDWVNSRWTGRCEVTNIEFILGQRRAGPKTFSPSIDRIDPTIGYTQENCRFVIWAFNALKHNGSDSDALRVAQAVVDGRQFLKNCPP
jgi:hypothetical protein